MSFQPTKFAIIPILDFVFAPDEEHVKKQTLQLIDENYMFSDNPFGFLHRGQTFSTDTKMFFTAKSVRNSMCHLDKSLSDRGDALIEDTNNLNRDRQLVTQWLSALLIGLKSLQDVRDALPDIAVNALPDLRGLERTRDVGWPLLNKPFGLFNYEKGYRLFVDCLANRMLF